MWIDKETLRVLKIGNTLANILIFFYRPLRAISRAFKRDVVVDILFALFMSGLIVVLLAM